MTNKARLIKTQRSSLVEQPDQAKSQGLFARLMGDNYVNTELDQFKMGAPSLNSWSKRKSLVERRKEILTTRQQSTPLEKPPQSNPQTTFLGSALKKRIANLSR